MADHAEQAEHAAASAPSPGGGFGASNLEIGTDSSDGGYGTEYASSIQSSTQSLESSIYRFHEENGRTYHSFNSGKYMLPNDDREQSRLDLQHHSFRIMLDNSLYMAPISNPKRVLDLATGTGIWAIEYAQEHPEAMVLGTDLSPIQPDFIPANCRFQVADAEEEWTFHEPFDYIHARAIVTCFKSNKAIAAKIFDALAPGGHFELQDPCFPMRCDDGTLAGTPLDRWNQLVIQGMGRMGHDVTDGVNWQQHLREAGFEDVVERRVYVPVNPWARGRKNKILGAISQQNLLEGIQSMSIAVLTRVLGWQMADVEPFLEEVKKDLHNKKIHAYGIIHFVHARKPMAATQATDLASTDPSTSTAPADAQPSEAPVETHAAPHSHANIPAAQAVETQPALTEPVVQDGQQPAEETRAVQVDSTEAQNAEATPAEAKKTEDTPMGL